MRIIPGPKWSLSEEPLYPSITYFLSLLWLVIDQSRKISCPSEDDLCSDVIVYPDVNCIHNKQVLIKERFRFHFAPLLQ